jgi:hypothetical protein
MKKDNLNFIISELDRNKEVFSRLLSGLRKDEYLWKQQPEKWCLLEIICHLHDEEREDFRARTKLILETPSEQFKSIDPTGWVAERNYINQNYPDMLQKFMSERELSINWLRSLTNPEWNNTYSHPKFGEMTAKKFLVSWLAHDYLHFRQITRLKYDYLKQSSGEELTYAGEW